MDLATQNHLKPLRDWLEYRLHELQHEVPPLPAELAAVRAALRRLDQGVYGDCTGCGEPIPLARLTAQPAAALCATCQADHAPAARA